MNLLFTNTLSLLSNKMMFINACMAIVKHMTNEHIIMLSMSMLYSV